MNAIIHSETIWITGASSGIGRSLAIALAEMGNKVIASARNQQLLDDLSTEYTNIVPLVFDVSDESQLERVKSDLSKISPFIDRVILNAGTCEYLDIDSPDWSMMSRVMSVNYFGTINTLSIALPSLQARPGGNGHIVGVVSLATIVPFSRAEAYGSSKAAMQYFLDSLRVDLQPQNIDVTVINPGFVKTPLTDKNDFSMPFLLEPEEAADRMLKAIARRPRQYDYPGRLKWLLILLGAIPWVWNRYVAPSLKS